MKIDFKVHGVSKGNANVRTEVDGEAMTATVPCTEVELVTLSERSGNLTLRLVGDAMARAAELFKQDTIVTATFEPKAG